MSRCEVKHPWSGLQCVLDAPHTGEPHDQNRADKATTSAQRREQLALIGADFKALVRDWLAVKGYVQEAVAAEILSQIILFCYECGMSERVLLTSFIGMMSPSPMPVDPSPSQALSYVAGVLLDIPIEAHQGAEYEVRITGRGIGKAEAEESSP